MSFPLPLVPARPDIFTLDEAVTRIRAALRVPRRKRIERRRWNEAAVIFGRFIGSTRITREGVDFSSTPYLVVHPEREIAAITTHVGVTYCAACDITFKAPGPVYIGRYYSGGERMAAAIDFGHRHNAALHPRRHARAQKHFQAPIPDAVRERAEEGALVQGAAARLGNKTFNVDTRVVAKPANGNNS